MIHRDIYRPGADQPHGHWCTNPNAGRSGVLVQISDYEHSSEVRPKLPFSTTMILLARIADCVDHTTQDKDYDQGLVSVDGYRICSHPGRRILITMRDTHDQATLDFSAQDCAEMIEDIAQVTAKIIKAVSADRTSLRESGST